MMVGAYGMQHLPERQSYDPDPQRNADRGAALESLFDTVWQCEREWRFDVRLDYYNGVQ